MRFDKKDEILFLIQYKGFKQPVITDASGKVDIDFNFEFGENTSIYQSCSMTYRNEFYVFGGETYYGGDRRQISKLSGCGLERIGTLDFDHYRGACTGVSDTTIYLCFSNASSDRKRCRYAENPLETFAEAASSFYDHEWTSIAASECKHELSIKIQFSVQHKFWL